MIKLFLMLFFLTSCASYHRVVCFNGTFSCVRNPLWDNTYIVQNDFKPYLKRFEQDYQRITNKELDTQRITIMYSRSVEALAVCEKEYLPNSGRIKVNKDAWFKASENEREEIIYHELGHCALNIIEHIHEMKDMRPVSLMYSTIIPFEVYAKYREEYLQRLFLIDMNSKFTMDAFSKQGEQRGLMKIKNWE